MVFFCYWIEIDLLKNNIILKRKSSIKSTTRQAALIQIIFLEKIKFVSVIPKVVNIDPQGSVNTLSTGIKKKFGVYEIKMGLMARNLKNCRKQHILLYKI